MLKIWQKLSVISVFCLTLYSFKTHTVLAKENFRQNISPSIQVAQNSSVDLVYNQMNQSMNNAFQEILPFLNGLNQLQNISRDEELLALTQQLTPMATRITTNFNQAYNMGEKMIPLLPQGTIETQYLQNIVTLNGLGYSSFLPWLEIFTSINQSYQTQNVNQLKATLQKIPVAINKIVEFSNQSQLVAQQGQQIQATFNPQNNSNNTMSPEEYQIRSNKSRMTHETNMNILRGMESDGEWRYNPATGQDEYKYF